MVKCLDWPIAVCTWSIKNDLDTIKKLADETGFTHLHLGVSPALAADGNVYLAKVKGTGLKISATMIDFPHEDYTTLDTIRRTGGIVPDEHWDADREAAFGAIEVTRELGVSYLTFHMGFIDLENPDNLDKLLGRVRTIADKAAENDITILLETGQETAAELDEFFTKADHPALGINFDPANIILYDKGNPIDAVKLLGPRIRHCHIKDANRTETPGQWGAEVPWSTGQVNDAAFLTTLREVGFEGVLAVEREAGDDRAGDIAFAIKKLAAFKG